VTTLDELDTPALLIDLDVLEANLAGMAAVAARAGVRLRPHTKTHKSPVIARMQLAAGAAGITCAKLGEAEVMADAGLDDLLIAYPLVGEAKLRRLRGLLERARVRVSLDSVEVAEGLGRVGRDLGRDVEVLAEVDTGLHRLGRPPGPPTAELVGQVARVPGVEVVGLLTHAGHSGPAPPRSCGAWPSGRFSTWSRRRRCAGATGSPWRSSASARPRRPGPAPSSTA
jgi:D-serine deaminase-like pyridoxal phosphate-dependent protein